MMNAEPTSGGAPASRSDLTLAEQVVLLAALGPAGGVPSTAALTLPGAVAGALLLELALHGRLALQTPAGATSWWPRTLRRLRIGPAGSAASLVVTDSRPLGDPVLDDLLQMLASHSKARPTIYWIEAVSKDAGRWQAPLDERMTAAGLLRAEPHHGFVGRRTAYALVDPASTDDVRARLLAALQEEIVPPARTALLLSLVVAADLLVTITDDRSDVARARRLVSTDNLRATAGELAETIAAVARVEMEATRQMGLPLLATGQRF